MPNETPKPVPLTLESVARNARANLLRRGNHPPTLIAEGDRKTIGTQIEALAPTHPDRAQQLFVLGLALAQSGEVGVLQQVFFIAEAWMSAEDPQKIRPAQDPQRKEVMLVSRHVIRPPRDETIIYTMRRDAKGKLTSVIRFPDDNPEKSEAHSPLLEAFVIGFLGSALKPDD